jgi:hypothetical protein
VWRLALALLIVTAACTGGNGTPTPIELTADPCGLLTISDVEAATGSTVTTTGVVPIDKLLGPELPTCAYKTNGKDGSIRVSVDPHGAATFAQYRDRDPANNLAVEDIGDEAFVHGLATLWVRIGDGYFAVSTQLGAGQPGVKTLKQLALDAIGHLPVAS